MTEMPSRKGVANESELNRDPITGTPGAHVLGTGAGAASGGVAGAAVGMALAGPAGAVIGAAVGAVAGGLAGKSAAEAINPTAEERFWSEVYINEPYFVTGRAYGYYARGFRAGWEGRVRHEGRSFDEAEAEMQADYRRTRSELDPDWSDVRSAAQAAWDRVDRNWKPKL